MNSVKERVNELLKEKKPCAEIGKILKAENLLYVNLEQIISEITGQFYDSAIEQLWIDIKNLLIHLRTHKKDLQKRRTLLIKENKLRKRNNWHIKNGRKGIDYNRRKREFLLTVY